MIKKELLLASWLEKLQKKWDNEEYYYDVEEATKVFKFVSKLTNDRGASRQFELLEFQFEIITEILCVKRRSDGKRKHREAHINIPRKNGKSFLAAIIVVYLFFCQRHIFGALFILTANTTKQAGELYATVEHLKKGSKEAGNSPAAAPKIKAGSVVTIKSGAVYGGLSSTRGKAVPAAQLGGKKHTVDKRRC